MRAQLACRNSTQLPSGSSTIAIVTPVSFLLNKVWTFSAVRGKHQVAETAEETVESEHPTAGV